MEVRQEPRWGALILQPAGEITIDNAQQLKNRARDILDANSEKLLVLDLSEVTFIDSSGIGFLIVLKSRCEEKDRTLVLLSPSPQARKILALVQLDGFFHIAEDADGLGAHIV